MFTLRFAFKNITSRKSSLVIIAFIAVSIGILVMANAVFDGTGTGIEKTFSANFTGDIVIRPKTDFPMSLFGDETPATGSLSELPTLVPFTNLNEYISGSEDIEITSGQITGQSAVSLGSLKRYAVLFGVQGESYVQIMSGIKILEGVAFASGEKGCMISSRLKEELESASGKTIQVGQELQFISSNGSSYTLRSAPVTAVYEYCVHNEIQDNIILVDSDTVRGLLGIESMSATVDIDSAHSTLIDDFSDVDDVFAQDISLEADDSAAEPSVTETVTENPAQEIQTTWNYLICKVKDKAKINSVIRQMNKHFSENEWQMEAVNWRTAAGMAAQYIYWMRLIFNIGLILIIGTGFIVVNNTLIIAAMDRTKETGALRAIGADRKFVAVEYLCETLMLTVTAGLIGIILGYIGNGILVNANITFTNQYLVQLFGGNCLRTVVTQSNILMAMGLSLLLAVIGWLYPVHIALDTSPVVAMEAVR